MTSDDPALDAVYECDEEMGWEKLILETADGERITVMKSDCMQLSVISPDFEINHFDATNGGEDDD